MRTTGARHEGIIFVVALAAALVYAFVFPQPIEHDSIGYEKLGYNLSQGNGFTYSFEAPFDPTSAREPAYPFFINIVYRVFGRNPQAVIAFQAILHALTAFLVYRLAVRWCSPWASLAAGLLFAADPSMAGMCGYLATEPLAVFLFTFFIYLMVFLKRKNGLAFAVVGGALLGFLTLTRAVFMLMPIFVLAYLVFLDRETRLRSRILQSVVVILLFMAVLAPWLYRNKKLFDVVFITTRSGHTLLWRAMRTEYAPKEMLIHMIYGASDTLGKKLYPDEYGRMTVRGEFGPDNIYTIGEKMYQDFKAKGASDLEADRELRRKALGIIREHPLMYAGQSFLELWKLSFFEIVPFAYSERFDGWMRASPLVHKAGTAIRIILRYAYSWLLLLLAFFGFLRIRHEWRRYSVLLLPCIYVVSTAVLVDSGPRYFYPAVPFMFVFVAVYLGRWSTR